jgi:hypothetical protein
MAHPLPACSPSTGPFAEPPALWMNALSWADMGYHGLAWRSKRMAWAEDFFSEEIALKSDSYSNCVNNAPLGFDTHVYS